MVFHRTLSAPLIPNNISLSAKYIAVLFDCIFRSVCTIILNLTAPRTVEPEGERGEAQRGLRWAVARLGDACNHRDSEERKQKWEKEGTAQTNKEK